jgi:hypothetical protein
MTTSYVIEQPMLSPLQINEAEMNSYAKIASCESIPEEHKAAYLLAKQALESKQCNEPYEMLLSSVLGLDNNPKKHGWDAWDNEENPQEFYEYKPSSNTYNPSGTINDDTFDKINKCKDLLPGQKGWLVLAGIDKTTYKFSVIYKFPIEAYHEDRIKYLNRLMEKNKKNRDDGKQTRSTYGISISKSVRLCKEQKLKYYVWKRD